MELALTVHVLGCRLGALLLYAIGTVILAVRESQRPVSENPWARGGSPQDGLRAG